MRTFTLELDDGLFRAATEAANAMGVTLNEYVAGAVAASLEARRVSLVSGVHDDLARYSDIIGYLKSH